MGPRRPALRPPLLLLLLLLFLDTSVWAQDEVLENLSLSCPKDATRFKHLRKYVYNYEAESSSSVRGTADSRSATKINCKVELEVPQLCSFVMRTSQCTLKEVYGFNPEGKALMKKTKNSDEFATAMSKFELKLAISKGKQVVLYPDNDEPKHILNIKRGIISALLVPPETEEDKQVLFLDTVYGNCSTQVTVNSRKGTVATEMSTDRNLQQCDGFQPISTAVSPLALIKGLVNPLATLVKSSQSCKYTLDPKRKDVSQAICNEQHLFLPFSYKNKYGIMTHVTQTLSLEDTPKINSRFFNEGTKQVGLAFESTKSTPPPKQADAVLNTLRELERLSVSEQNAQRANLFNKLVTELRGLGDEAIRSLLPQLIGVSSPITLQALVQCGQPQCYTHILQWLKTEKAHPLLIDIVTYLVALMPNPSTQRLQEIFNTAREQQSRATLYALSHVVNNYYTVDHSSSTDLQDIANYLLKKIDNECMWDEDHTYLILRVIGNTGRTMEQVMPALKSSVLNCVRSKKPSPLIQKAAIQALRKMELGDEAQRILFDTFADSAIPVENRLAAYLLLMKGPSSSDMSRIIQLLQWEQSEQVKNFVASHIANILNSEELYVQDLKNLIKNALEHSQLPTIMDFRKYSRNYQISKSVSLPSFDPVSAKMEGNLIFDPSSYLPKESMLKTTLTIFGLTSTDLFEIGLEGKGFEPTLEALFGKQGFFPDSVNKALYWVNGQVPDRVSKVLVDHFGYTRDDKHEQDMVNGIMPMVDKLIKDLKSKEIPEARAYLRILEEELGFVKLQDLQVLGRLFLNGAQTLRGIPQMIAQAIRDGSKNDLFLHYIFMDNAFELPTGVGLQLQVSSSGVITPGIKAGVRMELANIQAELVAKPSVSVEFVTNMGTIIPDFAKSGVQMNTNFFHESGLEARMALKAGQLKVVIPAPKRPIKLFSGSNTLHLVSTTKTEMIPPLVENRQSWSTCKPFFTGMNYCTTGAYSNASTTESASYYPLTGDTRYELELKPTGEVEQYSASATYEFQKEDKVDTLKFLVQAEGVQQSEATAVFKYNRRSRTLSSEVLIPGFDVDFGTLLRLNDESAKDKNAYKLILDIQNKKITEVALVGHVSYDRRVDGKIKGVISIPRLQAEARSEIHTHWSPTKLLFQMDSSATAYGSTISKRVAWRYDNEKIEFDWNAGTNVDTKKVASNFPVDLSSYPRTLHEYANGLLDHRVPQTDMTFRHMGSKLIVATNTWLQMASRGLPYSQMLQDHLNGLSELNLQKMGLPDFHIPDNLFLKSDGRVKYTLNKNSIKLEIPLPLGGKSSKDLRMPESVRTPALNFKSVGFHLPSQTFQVPTFTIPKTHQLQVPLLGVLDLSTNVYSNLYNWSASYTGGNTSKDHFSLRAQYRMKADSAVDLFSYSVQGSGETTYDSQSTFTLSCDGSLHHKFLDSKFKVSHVEKFGNTPVSKGLLTFEASSPLGPRMSATVHLDSKKKQHLYVKEIKVDGQFRASSFYAQGRYGLSCERDPTTGQLSGESNIRINSTYLQGTNQIVGVYQDGTFSLTSTSDLQDGIFKNTASLKYENYELTLKSDSSGQYENFAASNKLDLTFSRQSASLRSEHQANYKSLRLVTLLSGSVTSQGMELNADILGTDQINTGAHKATLKITRDGLSTSATSNLKYSPLLLENELNAELGLSGASMKLSTNGRFKEHHAKFSLDGKAALTEVSLGSIYQAMILGADSKNIFNFKLSREGLRLSNDMMGSYAEMKLDHAHSLSLAGLSLDVSSKMDNIYSADKFYKQNFNLQLQPYSFVAALSSDLRYNALDVANSGRLRLEPLTLNVGGNFKGTYQNHELKHIYTISYADLIVASYRADTVAKVQGVEFNHRLNADINGLASSVDVITNYNSDPLHFNNVFHLVLKPFQLGIDTHTSGDGKLALWGEHTGQLYNKFLLKAEPLALTFSHDFKGSTNHDLVHKSSISTGLEHTVSALLTPAEQTSRWKFKTRLNDKVYSQDFEAYNTKDKIGVELRGRADLSGLDSPIKVPFFHSEPDNVLNDLEINDAVDKPQEFTIVAFVKYDKNQDVHTISLPFFKSLPEYLERNRRGIITLLEAMQGELQRIDIDEFVRKYKAALSRLPRQIHDYLNASDWERQATNAKEKLTAFMENYKITDNDVLIALDSAKINFNEKLSQLETYVIQFDQYIRDNYDPQDFKKAIAQIIDRIIETLKILDEQYHIRVNLEKSIHNLYLFVENVDLNKIGSSAASWVQNVDTKYQIRIQIQEKLQQLRTQIQTIDIQQLAADLKQQVEAIDVTKHLDQLRTAILFQRINDIIERVQHFVRNLIEDFKVTEKINTFRAIVHELIEKYEVDRQLRVLMHESVELAHRYSLGEALQKLSNALQQIEIRDYYEKFVGFIDDAVKQLKALSFKNVIQELNRYLDMLVKMLKAFDYHQFIDETNSKIREVTRRINVEIQALELPQKTEALKLLAGDFKATVSAYLERLKNTKVTVFIDWLQDALVHIKAHFQDTLEDVRDRLYQMDIQWELEHFLSLVSQVYNTLVTYISDWWILTAKNITDFAEQYSIQNWAESVKRLVEQGFTVPEIRTFLGTMPAFEVSLRALQEANFQTPDFIVPLTDLRIPSIQINFKTLKNVKIPSRFSTPEFTLLNTFHIPSFTIDLLEIKAKIIRTIDQMLSSELQWPLPEVYLRDLEMVNIPLARLTLPDFHIPEITIPEFTIPNVNFKDFQVPDLHIPEFQLPRLSHTIEIPAFGKLHGILKIQSPLFTLDANANIQNVTTSQNRAQIVASVAATGESKFEALNFDFEAQAQFLELNPNPNPLVLKESMNFSSKHVRMEHEGEILFSGKAIEGKSDTVASLYTEKNTVEFNNSVIVKINNQLTLDSHTKYFHKLSIPRLDFSSKASFNNEIKTLLEAGHVAWTSSGTGSWNWACPNFSDEGIHSSKISFTVEGPVASFGLSNNINGKHLRVIQKLAYESGFLNYSKFEVESKVESQHVGSSILIGKGTVLLRDAKAEMTGQHHADLHGKVIGTLKNSLFFSAHPFTITASTNNEGNLKVSFPLKLTGKIDFLNNYALFLSPHAQQASWQAGARFNQYKYNQNFSAINNEHNMEARVGMNGDANLDFLNIPLTIPEITLPYTGLTTPLLKDFSIWEETGLKEFLKTTKQSFDLSVKAQYKKNRDRHVFMIPLSTFYEFILNNVNSWDRKFEKVRDSALDFLTTSYNEAKIKFDKYKTENSLIQPPRTFQSHGYTIPFVNIEVSPFAVETMGSSHVIPKAISTPSVTIPGPNVIVPSYRLVLPSLELPVLHFPRNLLKFSLPDFKELSPIDNIYIPALGNFTYDFSFKSSVITLNTNAGLYNQSDIVARFLSSSSFVTDALQYKLEGTSRLTQKRGLAIAVSLTNKFVKGNHDSTISLTKKNMEASMKTTASLHVPILTMNFKQELNGNVKSKPTLSSSIELNYDFNSSKLHSTAKGGINHKFSLESLTSYFSIESSTKGNIKGSVLLQEYSGSVASEANTYLNPKGTRSSVRLQGASVVDGIWNIEVGENFAGEATLRRIYATWEHSIKNHLQVDNFFVTKGKQMCRATLELSPWTMSTLLQVHVSQPSSLLDLHHFDQEVTLKANTNNQKVIWKSEAQINSQVLQHNVQFSNDQEEVRLDIAGSTEGQTIFLPVYLQKLLQMDGKRQYLQASTSLVYTKNPRGYLFSLPVQELADRFIIPGLKLNDFSGIKIYKKLSTSPFALNLTMLPKVNFPGIDVLTQYSKPEDSSVPAFEVIIPEVQFIVSQFTLPKSFPVGNAGFDLNEIANMIAGVDLPSVTLPEQTVEIPPVKFSVPAGIFIPFFGALTTHVGVASPVYNVTWSAGLKNKADHVETSLDSTCSSIWQFLEYDLKVVGTHKIEDHMFICKNKGTLQHRDFTVEYKDDGVFKGLWVWQGEAHLDITSPVLTELHLHYKEDEKSLSASAVSPAIGTVGLESSRDDQSVELNVYFLPQSPLDRKLSIFKTEWRFKKSEDGKHIKINWEEEAASRLLGSLKSNVPKATEAIYDYVNKYYLGNASSELRRSLQNNAESARKKIYKMNMDFQKAAHDAYQEWKGKTQNLYEEMLAQEGQSIPERLQDTVVDSLVYVTHKYHMAVTFLTDSFIHFLKNNTFQLPGNGGMYTIDELCTMVMRETLKSLSQLCSSFYGSLEKLLSYVQDLAEKLGLINDIKFKFPFVSKASKLPDVILEYRKLLNISSDLIQEYSKVFQNTNFTEILSDLQIILERILDITEENIQCLNNKEYACFTDYINTIFKIHIPNALKFLRKELYPICSEINDSVQSILQEGSYKLQQVHQYIKALREEYFDPSMVGWTVKYYEVEEKVVDLIKSLLVILRDFYSEHSARAIDFASKITTQVEQFMPRDIQECLSILADINGKGKEKIAELSIMAKETIKSWPTVMKGTISEYHQQFSSKLQDFSDQFSDYYEEFIAESTRLIDLSIQSYHEFLRYITKLLKELQVATANNVSPYIKLAPGELIITF
ncbi:apolipoprotein B-100 [Peromyscus maniculatus bairdii]|uniref:apolipoprotein B-100 n=1 Tax=Peromyscus maniculatus bairdii TaxID=230844 RepID=UPI00042A9E54|nr:apolipoprotein B-100 [Peromyscus maniculatus bairdii]